MTEDGIRALPLVSTNIIYGTIDGFDGQRGIAIGSRLSQDLGVSLGEYVTLVSPRGAKTPFGMAPRTRPYQVAAIFELGMSEYDRSMVFMPLTEAQRYFSKGAEVDVLELVTDDPEQIGTYIAEMRKVVPGDYLFTSWQQRNQTFFTVLEVERTVMFIIFSLIILVAALNIVSGIMMLVKDKGRDIAVLRTMGATKGAIMRVFLDHRRVDRCCRYVRRPDPWHHLLLAHRRDPPVRTNGHRHNHDGPQGVLFVQAASRHRPI